MLTLIKPGLVTVVLTLVFGAWKVLTAGSRAIYEVAREKRP